MKPFIQVCRHGMHFCARCLCSFALWTLWLALVALLVVQVGILAQRTLAVPGFVLNALEERLALSQLNAEFGQTSFDPSGRVLIQDVRLSAPGLTEPIARARAVYLRLDPWALLAGRFEPLELRASGVDFFVPSMFSASGHAEAVVRNLELALRPDENDLLLQQLSALVGPLVVSAHGRIHVAAWRKRRDAPLPIADWIAREYPQFSRHAAAYVGRLAALDEPRLELDFTPSETRGALVGATLLARGVRLEHPWAVEAENVVARTRFPASGEHAVRARLRLSAAEVKLPRDLVVRGIHAEMRGSLQPAQRTFEPQRAEISLAHAVSAGVPVSALSAQWEWPGDLARGSVIARLADAPVALTGGAQFKQKTADLHVDTTVTPAVLDSLGAWFQRDLSALLELHSTPAVSADVTLAPGWKLGAIDARVAAGPLTARKVALESVTGRLRFSGREMHATDIVLRQGENIARGSYAMDTATRDFRFLLEGRLRPLGISGWFRDWWPRLFANFDFTAAVPDANVDVQGRWREPRLTTVFLQVSAASPVVRTVPFDYVNTVLFIRPHYHEAREFFAARADGFARGTFARELDPGSANPFRRVKFAVTSTLDIQEGARLFGQPGLDIVAPFRFSSPPRLTAAGELTGPGAPEGKHETVHIEGSSIGAFQLFDFPLNNLTFTADLRDDNLVVQRADAIFAEGVATGHVRLWGRGEDRQIGFDYTLRNAKLGAAIITVENFAAQRNRAPVPAKSAFLEKAADVRLDLSASAVGKYQDLFSFHGEGNADLAGPELGEVRLLGLLSELLNFTSLRFTAMRTHFKLEGSRLVFPEVKLTGANSAIDAKEAYALDRKELDFTAKVFPFGESRFIPQAVIGAVLSPLSQVLEVKLTGNLAKPSWAFVLGPTNFFRNLVTPRQGPPDQQNAPAPAEKSLSPYLKR